jgi:hypothetical protein
VSIHPGTITNNKVLRWHAAHGAPTQHVNPYLKFQNAKICPVEFDFMRQLVTIKHIRSNICLRRPRLHVRDFLRLNGCPRLWRTCQLISPRRIGAFGRQITKHPWVEPLGFRYGFLAQLSNWYFVDSPVWEPCRAYRCAMQHMITPCAVPAQATVEVPRTNFFG